MPSYNDKKKMYADARIVTGCNQKDWARLFNLGGSKGQPHVSNKESGARGVNMPEALSSELLAFLFKQGFDVKNTHFDVDGLIIEIPRIVD
jgi:hypothetical protein